MKNNSKKREGFTLIEIIISIAVIGIISIGVYNAFGIMIKQTKAGQMKQISALIGKEISEEIKSIAENKVTENASSIYVMTDSIHFTKSGSGFNSTPIYFNEEGNIVNSASRYTAEISLEPKLPEHSTTIIAIDEFTKNDDATVENKNVCIVKQGTNIKAINIENDSSNNHSSNIDSDENIEIKIIDSDNRISSSIKLDTNDPLEYTFVAGKTPIINLDLRYCTGKVTISVDNRTKTPLNLCILNNNNAEIQNTNGVVNEYYRSEDGNKIGILYDVTVKIKDNRSAETPPIFQAVFAQNINIR